MKALKDFLSTHFTNVLAVLFIVLGFVYWLATSKILYASIFVGGGCLLLLMSLGNKIKDWYWKRHMEKLEKLQYKEQA